MTLNVESKAMLLWIILFIVPPSYMRRGDLPGLFKEQRLSWDMQRSLPDLDEVHNQGWF